MRSHHRLPSDCGIWSYRLGIDRFGARDDNRIDVTIEKEESYICALEESAFAILMVYNQVVFCNIHTECGSEFLGLGQCNSVGLT
jgi:hypothetical protein